MKILLGDFSKELARENIFKPIIWSGSSKNNNNNNNNNGVRIVSFTTSKIMVVNSMVFPPSKLYNHTWTYRDGKNPVAARGTFLR